MADPPKAQKVPATRFSKQPSQTSPSPIPEETDESIETSGLQLKAQENNTRSEKSISSTSMASSYDAKQSALIPNSNIPLNDGTHWVTFHIQMTSDTHNVEKQSDELTQSISSSLRAMECYTTGIPKV